MPTPEEIDTYIDENHPSNSELAAAQTRSLLKYIKNAIRAWLDDEVINNVDQEGGFAKITSGHIDMDFVFDGTITNGRVVYINNGQPTATTIEFSGDTTNFPGALQIDAVQVVSSRITGWATPSGTPSRTIFNADETTTADPSYQQAQIQEVVDRLTETRQRLKAVIDDLRSHGLIGT